MKIATHNGSFHADDIFGVAVLHRVFPGSELIRTRDQGLIADADFAVDVGGVWDPSTGRFDHHQKGFCGQRDSGVVYASSGLVWATHGAAYIESVVAQFGLEVTGKQINRIWDHVDLELVQYLDMVDTGAETCAPGAFGLSTMLALYNPTWVDLKAMTKDEADEYRLERFKAAMAITGDFLTNQVREAHARVVAANNVRLSPTIADGRVLVLADGAWPWEQVVSEQMPNIHFVIYPDSSDSQFQIRTVNVSVGYFDSRQDLPEQWAGLRGAELAAVTGVEDAVFCHNKLFIAGARTYDGAVKMAMLALDDRQ